MRVIAHDYTEVLSAQFPPGVYSAISKQFPNNYLIDIFLLKG